MLLDKSAYEAADCPLGKPLLQMSDFNSLIALSQEHSAPIFDMSDRQLGQTGIVLEATKKSMLEFRTLYSDAADRIKNLIEHA